MFSQFRNAVEHLSTQQPRRSGSQDASSPTSVNERPSSADSQGVSPVALSSSQLADSVITNLRKSLATQRVASPKPATPPDSSKPRSKLEERLRASLSFSIGEASNSTTPESSTAAVTPVPPPKDTLSPASTPLPNSPPSSPSFNSNVSIHPLEDMSLSSSQNKPLAQPIPVRADPDFIPTAETLEAAANDHEPRYLESNIPIPETPPPSNTEEEVPISAPSPIPGLDPGVADVEALRQQLKRFKERFTDVSSSFKRLQAEKLSVDKVLQEFTPLQSMTDTAGLREYVENISLQTEMSQDEIKRLNGKLLRQEERIEELRDTHHLESKSQSDQIDRLRKNVDETEVLLKAAQSSEISKSGESDKINAEVEKLKAEVETLKNISSQEEEKRTKAITLLKTVRQKLVKAEKERDDAVKEVNDLKEKDRSDRNLEKAERLRLQEEIEQGIVEREKAVVGLKVQFDKEVTGLKDRQEKEISALRGQFELEAIARKTTHSKELESRNQQIFVLEKSMQNLTREKDRVFDEFQLRQAELESTQAHMESLQSQTTEFQFQIRELNQRNALLTDELAEACKEAERTDSGPDISAEEVAQLISNTEVKYEARLADLRRQLDAVEQERNDADADWSLKFSTKVNEVEELKKAISSSTRTKIDHEQLVLQFRNEIEQLKDTIRKYEKKSLDLQRQAETVRDVEDTAQMQLADLNGKNVGLQMQIEEIKERETQLRASNKTLREELRKVQSSAALLERQRNPGLGYWASRDNVTESRTSISSTSDLPSRVGSPVSSSQRNGNEEEVNLEYLRNIILQFLERKEMRPNLVRVLSTVLRFTPQETRRLSRSL